MLKDLRFDGFERLIASLRQLNVHSNLFSKQIAVLDNDQVDACGDHGGWSAVANTRKCPKTQVSLSS